MSGLLVKSTIIIRENLQELNNLGLADTPVMLGGAALTRNYVEVDLRKVYEGRLFYGKDAFEGLHTMDTLMSGLKSGDLDPEFGQRRGRSPSCRRASRSRTSPRWRYRPAPMFAIDVPIFTPPFIGIQRREGDLAGRDRHVHQRDHALPEPVAVPASGRAVRRRVQGQHPAAAPRPRWTKPRPKAGSYLPSRGATSPSTRRATTSSCGRTTTVATSACGSTSRASARTASSASPTSSDRSRAAKPTTRHST